jgi:hypothetical protein
MHLLSPEIPLALPFCPLGHPAVTNRQPLLRGQVLMIFLPGISLDLPFSTTNPKLFAPLVQLSFIGSSVVRLQASHLGTTEPLCSAHLTSGYCLFGPIQAVLALVCG